LDQAAVSNFFRAQIEANKLVQYSLLAEWRRVGQVPDHTPVNLAETIRPELDQLETALIAELAETAGIRASESCRTEVAKAVGKYVSAHKGKFSPLRAIALDRALAASCTS
jgi:chorismate mutase